MLWLSDRNYVTINFVKQDERGRVRAAGTTANKNMDGSYSYMDFDVRFNKNLNQRVLSLPQGRNRITVTKGGVELYKSTKYKSNSGKPVTMFTLVVNDFTVESHDRQYGGQQTTQQPPSPKTLNDAFNADVSGDEVLPF